ncbi:hypothetical protein WJX72_003768 [[Myrmecia] bisecta]|uniref:Uncharacterized protein n=1 Tax=[Myrmecia] bisecta TaxID=41462 RepID=A0AAW1PG39_9CHLO
MTGSNCLCTSHQCHTEASGPTAVGRFSSSASLRSLLVARPSARPPVRSKPGHISIQACEVPVVAKPPLSDQPAPDPVRKKGRGRPKCAAAGCEVTAYFNDPEATCGRFCAAHREQGMINVVTRPWHDQRGCQAV